LPFEGIEFEGRQSMKYRSEIDVEKVIAEARRELEHNDPEAYKVFLLAVGLGLRRKEIDLLEWPSFRWSENVLRIEPTRYFHPKTEDSIADLPVGPELMDVFRKLRWSQGVICDQEPSAALTSTAASVFST
jgi:integrase